MDILEEVQGVMEEEVRSVKNVIGDLSNNDSEINQIISCLTNLKGRLIFTGIGKSGHIGEKLAATFSSTGTPSFFVHSAEAMHGDLGMITKEDIVINISNSGETQESLNVVNPIHNIGATIIAMTGNSESTLAKKCDYTLLVHVDKEADEYNLAPTSSSTAVLIMDDAIALTISKLKGFQKEDFAKFHPGGSLGKRLLEEKIFN